MSRISCNWGKELGRGMEMRGGDVNKMIKTEGEVVKDVGRVGEVMGYLLVECQVMAMTQDGVTPQR